MKALPSALETHYAGRVTTLATCVKLTRRDGTILGFTDCARPLTVEGLTYQPGYTPSAITTSGDLAVDNLDMQGRLASPLITEADLIAGKWDHARIEVRRVNYLSPASGAEILRVAHLGEVTIRRAEFVAEVRGLMQALQQPLGRHNSHASEADKGDTRCGVTLASFTVTGSVTAAASNAVFTDSARTEAAEWFRFGKLTWTSGANNGLAMEVKGFSSGKVFTLAQAMPYAIALGDAYSVYAGCDKSGRLGAAHCKTKFSNYLRFRGFEDVPGINAALNPTTRSAA